MADDSGRPTFDRFVIVTVLAALAVLALFVHALFPRYEFRPVNPDGTAIVVYDRWSGRFQRAVYDADGRVKPMDVYTPF
jgi:hypothetical protein